MKAANRRGGGTDAYTTRYPPRSPSLYLAPIRRPSTFKSQLYTVYFVLARLAIINDTVFSVLCQIKRREGHIYPEAIPLT